MAFLVFTIISTFLGQALNGNSPGEIMPKAIEPCFFYIYKVF